ncbi:MAG: alpha/beta hydrolase, partial [Proteobacteria bacterium]|nr:alpha/beta hydrolase [Pseudomonadota bacterium]
CDLIYVVGLNGKQRIEESDYPGTKIVNITLSENYKSIIPPSLNFSPELIKERIEKGYRDGKKILKRK